MSDLNIEPHYKYQYTDNVRDALQIKSCMRGMVEESEGAGEGSVSVELTGSTEALEISGNYKPMPRIDRSYDRVWCYPKKFHHPELVRTMEKVKTMTDPQSAMVRGAGKAMARKFDRYCFAAAFGNTKTGKEGDEIVAFDDSAHKVTAAIGASAATGMNVEKIIEGVRLMEESDVDIEGEDLVCVITPTDHANMLNQTRATSKDFIEGPNGTAILQSGRLKEIGGVMLKVSRLVPVSSSERWCPLFIKPGIHVKVWNEIETFIDPRPDIEERPTQVLSQAQMGFTRTEPGMVIKIATNNT